MKKIFELPDEKYCVNKFHITFFPSRLSALHRATEIERQEKNVLVGRNAKCSWNFFPKTCVEIGNRVGNEKCAR